MRIIPLFDKKTAIAGLRTGWGVSFLVGENVVFDTGENGAWLLSNMRNMGIPAGNIKKVVISHDHWDHKGGLRSLLDACPRAVVYGCPDFGLKFKASVHLRGHRLVETACFLEISDGVFTTGQVAGYYKGKFMPEQALVIKTHDGLNMITGCAHPGIIRMVEHANRYFKRDVSLIAGGFHLYGRRDKTVREVAEGLKDLGVKKLAPCHCTGSSAERILEEEFGDGFISISAGNPVDL